jgi:hypothetical protein
MVFARTWRSSEILRTSVSMASNVFSLVVFLGHERKAQELSSLRTVGQVAKAIAHTEPHHHLTYEFGHALKVVPCSS